MPILLIFELSDIVWRSGFHSTKDPVGVKWRYVQVVIMFLRERNFVPNVDLQLEIQFVKFVVPR
jgi:hypothetical protein